MQIKSLLIHTKTIITCFYILIYTWDERCRGIRFLKAACNIYFGYSFFIKLFIFIYKIFMYVKLSFDQNFKGNKISVY